LKNFRHTETTYVTTKNNDSVCCLPLKSVSGSENSRLDHDGKQQRSIANVQNARSREYATDQRLSRSRSWYRWRDGVTSFATLL